MTGQDWEAGFGRSIMVFLNGAAIPDVDARGDHVLDDSFLLCFNAHEDDITMTIPDGDYGEEWAIVLDTATGEAFHRAVAASWSAGWQATSSRRPARWRATARSRSAAGPSPCCCAPRTPNTHGTSGARGGQPSPGP